jgi:ABC-type transport system substrate-binding protein
MRANAAEMIAASLGREGIAVRLKHVHWYEYLDELAAGQTDAFLLSTVSPDPADAWELWHSSSLPPRGSNFFRIADHALDSAVSEFMQARGPSRKRALESLARTLDECAPCAFLSRSSSLHIAFGKGVSAKEWIRPFDNFLPIESYSVSKP